MKNQCLFLAVSALALTCLLGCAELQGNPGQSIYSPDPYYRNHPNNRYGYGGYDDYQIRRDRELNRRARELDRQREELEEERRNFERTRRTKERLPSPPPGRHSFDGNPHRPDRCPHGWKRTDRKCTTKQRRRGCKDMKTATGQGCIRY